MRVLVACVVAGCHTTPLAPPPRSMAQPVTIAPVARDPEPASTLSFLERVSPHEPISIQRVEVVVARRDGPEAIEALLPTVSEAMRECYTRTWLAFTPPRQDHLTMTIGAGGTTVEIEPAIFPAELATCFVRSVVSSRLDARARVVLAIDARTWLTYANDHPP